MKDFIRVSQSLRGLVVDIGGKFNDESLEQQHAELYKTKNKVLGSLWASAPLVRRAWDV